MSGRAVLRTSLAAAAAIVLAAAGPDRAAPSAASATGEGSMSFGDDDLGRAYLRFEVQDGESVTGSLLFAAEDHHDRFPDIVVQMGTVEKARFGAAKVEFSGPGALHDDPVSVTVKAFDRAGSGRADRFVITCTDPGGNVVFEADGELFRGDIAIATGSSGLGRGGP